MECMNLGWEFLKLGQVDFDQIDCVEAVSFDRNLFEKVDLPHTWYSEENPYKGSGVYRKRMVLSYEEGKRIFLNFQAADRWCKVFVNRCLIGEHKGGYSAFTFDITKYCKLGEENEFLVFLDNRSWEEISPLTGDFTVFGGLYRDVNLILTEKI